jgi:hypothetical protein
MLMVAATGRAQYGGEVSVNAVVAPVTVRDDAGRIMSDVTPSRFHLYVDGMEVPIRDFSRESDLPLSLAFIVDGSGSMAGRKLTACQELVRAFLDQRRQDDQLALWTFGDERVVGASFAWAVPAATRAGGPSVRGARPRSMTWSSASRR